MYIDRKCLSVFKLRVKFVVRSKYIVFNVLYSLSSISRELTVIKKSSMSFSFQYNDEYLYVVRLSEERYVFKGDDDDDDDDDGEVM